MQPTAPKYVQIKEHLRRRMEDGHIDCRVPSENELARRYRVSRMTARKALNELLRDGLVERIPGKGTFVKRPQLTQAYFQIHAFAEHANRLGMGTRTQVLRSAIDDIPARLRDKLPGHQAVCLHRIHYLGHQPVCYEARHLRADWCAPILTEDLAANSVHKLIVETLRLPIRRVWQRLEAVALEATVAEALQTTAAAPAFCMQQMLYTAEAPISYVDYFLRSDVYAFEESFDPGSTHADGWSGNGRIALENAER